MIFYLTTLPGWSSITTDELKVQLGQTAGKVIKLSHWDLLPVIDGDASRLRQLRTAEDVFVGIGSLDLTGRPTDVKALIAAGLWREPLQRALAEWSAATGRPLVKRLTWRVVVQAEDAAWRQYRRQELTMAAEAALLRVGGSWRVRRDEAPLELWLWQTGRKLLVTLRLTDNAARQHGGRAALLTSEWEALKAALTACPELRLERTVRDVSILGRRADVFVLRRL